MTDLLKRLQLLANGIPFYVQLREQILQAIGDGTLPPGARLPTMREVAVTLKVDLNTVQRAYAALERDGVLETVRGRGTFVRTAPPVEPSRRAATLEEAAYRTIASARSLGLDPAELARAILRIAGAPTS